MSDDVGISSVKPLPKALIEDAHWFLTGNAVLIGQETAADSRANAQAGEKFAVTISPQTSSGVYQGKDGGVRTDPSASERTTTMVKPGDLRRTLKA